MIVEGDTCESSAASFSAALDALSLADRSEAAQLSDLAQTLKDILSDVCAEDITHESGFLRLEGWPQVSPSALILTCDGELAVCDADGPKSAFILCVSRENAGRLLGWALGEEAPPLTEAWFDVARAMVGEVAFALKMAVSELDDEECQLASKWLLLPVVFTHQRLGSVEIVLGQPASDAERPNPNPRAVMTSAEADDAWTSRVMWALGDREIALTTTLPVPGQTVGSVSRLKVGEVLPVAIQPGRLLDLVAEGRSVAQGELRTGERGLSCGITHVKSALRGQHHE